jgi:hypothetical protein
MMRSEPEFSIGTIILWGRLRFKVTAILPYSRDVNLQNIENNSVIGIPDAMLRQGCRDGKWVVEKQHQD